MAEQRSISFCKGQGSINHNNRIFVHKNVDAEKIKDNIVFKQESIEKAYEKCFQEAVNDYNISQKRKDRKIINYLEQIQNSKNGEKIFYENVVQIGNKLDTGIDTPTAEKAKKILIEYMNDFQERNPNLYVFNAVMHLDEATPHLHIDYIPIARNYQRGLQIRNSLDKALRQQGIDIDGTSSKHKNRTLVWQEIEKKRIEEIILKHGLERQEEKGLKREHMTVNQYKTIIETVHNEIKQLPQNIEESPVLLNSKKIIVSKEALEQLKKRAKLSLIHEQNSKQLEEKQSLSSDLLRECLFQVKQKSLDMDKYVFDAKNSYEDATALKDKYFNLYEKQKSLNDDYASLQRKYETLNQDYRQILLNNSVKNTEFQKENNALKLEIAKLEESGLILHENAMLKQNINRTLKKTIEALENEEVTLKENLQMLKSKYNKLFIENTELTRLNIIYKTELNQLKPVLQTVQEIRLLNKSNDSSLEEIERSAKRKFLQEKLLTQLGCNNKTSNNKNLTFER